MADEERGAQDGRGGMSCPNCGGTMVGDGYMQLRHCEFARDEDCDGLEPDAGPVYCPEIETTESEKGKE